MAKVVTEYALSENLPGGEKQGLFSSTSLAVVQAVQAQHAIAGKTDTSIAKRVCTYPVDDKGRVNHNGSTVDETAVDPA